MWATKHRSRRLEGKYLLSSKNEESAANELSFLRGVVCVCVRESYERNTV